MSCGKNIDYLKSCGLDEYDINSINPFNKDTFQSGSEFKGRPRQPRIQIKRPRVLSKDYLNIDSRFRDVNTYPKVNSYKIQIPTIKNVKIVKMISIILPNKNNVLNEGYLVMKIDEINGIQTNDNKGEAFSILHLKQPTSGGFIMAELGCSLNTATVFKIPTNLNTLTISFYTPDGTLFDFGEPDGNVSSEYQNSFILEITKEVVQNSIDNCDEVY